MLNKNKCRVEMTLNGPEIKGNCKRQLKKLQKGQFDMSKRLNAEISSQLCINKETGNIDKAVIDTKGNRTSTLLRNRRICPMSHIQLSMHTHPLSGIAKFSEPDALTSVDRMNKDIDEGHCIIGEKESSCLIKFKERF